MIDLNISLVGVDTSYPSIAVGDVRVGILNHTIKESQKTAGFHYIKVDLETQEPVADVNNKILEPGFKFSTNLSLPDGKDTEQDDMRKKSLGSYIDAVIGSNKDNRPALTTELLQTFIGKSAIAKIGKSKDTTFGETEVKGFKHIPTA